MGQRQDNLSGLLDSAGYPVDKPRLRLRRQDIEASGLGSEVQSVYERLDGELDDFPDKVGGWDLRVGAVIIELDEAQHFNRCRLQTLESSVYSKLPKFPMSAYRSYCVEREAQCLAAAKNRGYWSNPSCIRQFGPKSPEGDLAPPGSPRWKQRAFYDFLKDLSPIMCDIRLARISIWDEVPANGVQVPVNQVLRSRSLDAVPGLVTLIEKRAGVNLKKNEHQQRSVQPGR